MKTLQSNFIKTAAHLLFVFACECLLVVGFYFCYSIFSMLVFGEGVNSFMYSRKSEIIFYSIVSGGPLIYNLKHAWKGYKSNNTRVAIVFLIVTAVYLFLVLSAMGQGR